MFIGINQKIYQAINPKSFFPNLLNTAFLYFFFSQFLGSPGKAYPSGDIIWNLGYELGSGDIDCGQDIGFSFQHSLQKLNNGNILTFDNGNLSRALLNQDEKTSRSIEIDITEIGDGCEASLEWE